MRQIHLSLFFCFFSSLLSATTYYLDQSGGNDANDGLSPATAWKSFQKIRNNGPVPGDTYLLKRGEIWEAEKLYITHAGTAANRITYGAYDTGNKPIITMLSSIAGATTSSNWQDTGGNIWELSLSQNPYRLFVDGQEVLRGAVSGDVGQVDTEGLRAIWFFDDTNNALKFYATQNPASTFSTLSGSFEFNAVQLDVTSYITLENLDIQAGGFSLALTACNNIIIRNCDIGKNAQSGLLLQSSNNTTPTTLVEVYGNTFDAHFTFFYGQSSDPQETARGCGDGINLARGATNCLIRNNTFKNWAHNAIELLCTSASETGVNDNTIQDNYIHAPDIPYAHPFGADGLDGKCQGNVFQRNRSEDCRTAAQVNGNDNWVHHNSFFRMRQSPAKQQSTAYGLSLGIYGAGLVCKNNRYDHNVFEDLDEAGILLSTYGFAGTIEGNYFRNNIILNTGLLPFNDTNMHNVYNAGTGIIIFDAAGDGTIGENFFQNNLIQGSLSTQPVYVRTAPIYLSINDFNAYNGTNNLVIANNIAGDPLLNTSFVPANNSPVVNAGIDTGLALDCQLGPRLVGAAPDIGKIETSVVLPVEWLHFAGQATRNGNELTWEVMENEATDYYEIERRTPQSNWQKLAQITAHSAITATQKYRYTDSSLAHPKSYYRILQVDKDGTFQYSSILLLQRAISTEVQMQDLGNGHYQIHLTSAPKFESPIIKVYDAVGRLIFTQRNPEIDLQFQPNGIYFLAVGDYGVFKVVR